MESPGIVISASELRRIREGIGAAGPDAEATQLTKTRAQLLHEKSQARAKTWSNTLEGSRRKKAEEKRKKFEMEELERQKVDAEEAKIQLDQRRATIDRANKLLYEESDRIKSFHSKMMLCDVIAEREAQTSLKGELKKLEQIREDRFLEMEKQNYRKMLEREMKEKETKEELSKIAARAQKEQLSEYKEKRFQEVEDAMLEGELLRRKALEDLEAEREAEQKRRGMAVKAQKETQKANAYLKQIKAEDMLRQQKEEEKIQEYAARKEKMMQLRKQKEEEVFQQKQAARNAMIDAQAIGASGTAEAANADAVAKCYSGPEQNVWELVMGKQIDIGGASSTLELAQRAGVGPGMKGVELNCNNGGGMRALVRLAGVDSMIGVDLTKSVVETGMKRTEEEGLSDKIKFINKNSLENGLPDASADFVYSKDAWCYMPDKQKIIDQAARIVKPGGKVMFTDWIEGEGLSDQEAQRYLSLMTFPAIPTVKEYAHMLQKGGFEVEIAENSGRYLPAMNSYVHMLKRQSVYDAKKLLNWDDEAYNKLISDFEFMAKRLAEMQDNEDARVEGQVKAKEADDERKRLAKLDMMA
ncbi:unnamed protein product, partial [Effrenium voratum]